jgi:hypothetical protein
VSEALTLGPRFWSKVRLGSCFEWQAAITPDGYGAYKINGRMHRVHRLVWEALNGPIPEGMCVLHHCDNPPCVNPRHLFLGTRQDNMADRDAKGRSARGETNGRARLSGSDVASIRAAANAGVSPKRLAEFWGLNRTYVQDIIAGRTWAHV